MVVVMAVVRVAVIIRKQGMGIYGLVSPYIIYDH